MNEKTETDITIKTDSEVGQKTNIRIEKIKESRIRSIDINKVAFGSIFSDHMFIADFEAGDHGGSASESEWKNFRIIPYGPMPTSPSIMALHYGQTVFEGMKAFKNGSGEVFLSRMKDHSERLNISAERMCMPGVPFELFRDALESLISLDSCWIPTDEDSSLYIRPFIYASEEHVGVRPSKKYTFVILTCPANVYFSKPLNVKVEASYTRAAPGGTGFAKTGGNYAGSLLPTEKGKAEGFDQIIWTDSETHKKIEESGAMNLMFVIDGKILTPSLSDTILKGITRDTILKIAQMQGVEIFEKELLVSEIEEALKNGSLTEAFGTGTAVVVAPIESITIDDVKYSIPNPALNSASAPMPSSATDLKISIAKTIADQLKKIRRGETSDKFGWMKKIV